jgi:hypothetical protein
VVIGVAVVAVALVVGWLVFGPAGEHPPTDDDRRALAAEECPRVTSPHFYVIEKDGKRSWLLGTRHAGVSLAKYPPAVATAFASATTAVFEAIDDGSPAKPDSATVDVELGDDAWQHYVDLVGEDTAARVRTTSIFTATAVLTLLYEDTSQAIDRELVNVARERKIRMIGLEDQSATSHLTEHYLGADMLTKGLQELPRRAYLEAATRHGLHAYCTATPAPRDVQRGDDVTNQRTRSWIATLVPLLATGGVFIAVGAEHVDQGSLGLPELLEAEGFTVKPGE